MFDDGSKNTSCLQENTYPPSLSLSTGPAGPLPTNLCFRSLSRFLSQELSLQLHDLGLQQVNHAFVILLGAVGLPLGGLGHLQLVLQAPVLGEEAQGFLRLRREGVEAEREDHVTSRERHGSLPFPELAWRATKTQGDGKRGLEILTHGGTLDRSPSLESIMSWGKHEVAQILGASSTKEQRQNGKRIKQGKQDQDFVFLQEVRTSQLLEADVAPRSVGMQRLLKS